MRRLGFAISAAVIALQDPVPGSGFQVAEPGTGTWNPEPVRAIVSRADLIYTTPVARSEEGLPIGNGRIGAIVWTTPSALTFQINRVDIEPIDLELAGAGADLFTADGTHQRLSIYEGLLDVRAAGVHARMLAWHERDVIAIEIDDRRAVPEPIQINLRMPRPSTVRARDHAAESQIAVNGGRILLSQNFQEGADGGRSAVAIALLGRRTLTRVANESDARIVSPAGRGRVVVLIASAATRDAGQDVAAVALSNLDAAADKSFDDLAGDNAEWWYAFWQLGTVALHSPDGTAEEAADNYHYYLYLMHATVNRLTLRDGPQASDAQRLGEAADALQLALLQSAPDVPGGDSIVHLFPGWPDQWDAQFTLRAQRGFIVTASKRAGRVELVRLRSEAGAIAQVRNPWSATEVVLFRNGKRGQQLKGSVLSFDTEVGEVVEIRGN